jgi:predicted acyltransferase
MSLDVFRGATIAAMMLVNNPGDWGSVYAPLKHAPWHGWTFTDLIFPFFLWIVGMAIPLSISRRLEGGASRAQLFSHAVRRACIIFALGFFLNSFGYLVDGSLFRGGFSEWLRHYLTTVRVPGVLQRIAICYLAAIGIYLCGGIRAQWAALATLLLGYWLMMTVVPVPGHGPGVLEKEGNLSQYIDNLVMNRPAIGTHVYEGSKIYDPEGVLSTLPAIGTCIFGVLAGMLLQASKTREEKTAWMFTGGAALLWAGQLFNLVFPINKEIWTSSYTVFMAGMAMTCFACCYWLVDIQGWKKFPRPFAIYGMNAITVFVLSGMLGRLAVEIRVGESALKTWLFKNSFGMIPDPRLASLCWALMWVLLLYGVAWAMHRRKWFVRF